MKYRFSEIASLIKHSKSIVKDEALWIDNISFDSRNISFASTSLFFAFKGKRLDAHSFVNEAYQRGVRSFVLTNESANSTLNGNFESHPDINILYVENVVDALQQLAAAHRSNFKLPVIGITGSNGKTIIKEWLNQLLTEDFYIVRSPRSYNSQLGVPLSVLEISENHQLGIFEAGISQTGEMDRLSRIIQCSIGIFTNIGDAHNEGFANQDQKIREKFKLFEHANLVVYCRDYEVIERNKPSGLNSFTWSKKDSDADFFVKTEKNEAHQYTRLDGTKKSGEHVSISIPFTDDASVENAIHCWCILQLLNIPVPQIQQRMLLLQPVALRLDLKAGINNCIVINDAYSLDLTSLAFAVDFMIQQSQNTKSTLILSDIQQSGLPAVQLYEQVAKLINERKISRLIGIGNDIPVIKKYLNEKTVFSHHADVGSFLEHFSAVDFANETILLKGARSFAFERIAERLELKAHRTVLEINLDAIRHNLTVYNGLLSAGTKVLVMVKAAAYGSGSAEVAKLLEYHKVDYFGVAYTDEAISLRKEGIKVPILVLNPDEASFHALFRYDIEPEVYSISQLESLLPYLSREERTLKIHLKLDTGMHRLGFDSTDIPNLLQILRENRRLHVQSVFSHLAASDEAVHDGFTREQAALFGEMYAEICAGIGYKPMRHLCNTGGVARFAEYHFEMVRLGIGIYGVDSSKKVQSELQVVNTLKATISQIKNIPQGETIGYGRRGIAERDIRIATISIGYADGFLRSAGHGKFSVNVHGKMAPVIGTICMDMCMIDITDIPEAREGDTVVIFGQYPTVDDLAAATNTISYEVLTNISDRVKRVYFRE